MDIQGLKEKVLSGYEITKEEAIQLYEENIEELKIAADDIRKKMCGNSFDICTIINSKSGRCSENCTFCAQSAHYDTEVDCYGLLPDNIIIEDAIGQYRHGILRYSLVSSGKGLTDKEIQRVCNIVREIKKRVPIKICISAGLISKAHLLQLKKAGVERIHNNVETSRNYFPKICTTHSYDQKIEVIKKAKEVGMEICTGGIFGLGESKKDRIDMAFDIKKLGIRSVPINILHPIPNTPLENNKILSQKEIDGTIAIYRFIMPKAILRLAGGRAQMEEHGKTAFQSGANAAISGDLLTTHGVNVKEDMAMIKSLDFNIELIS
ncbi:MAG: biotin synthase BioB [Tissierellia bacterium]|nr:biotin synthase BioB [Tissierellia bacterium]